VGDEVTKLVMGDAAISAIEDASSRSRRFFGRKKTQRPPLTQCENCGAPLQGHWCAQCGQPAIDYRRSFRHVIADLLDEFLNWDSKFFTTIALLILKPWRLTNEFLAGKRVRYVNPLRLYLLASILFFFAANFGAKGIRFDLTKFPEEKRAEVAAAIADKREEIEAELKKEGLTPEQRRRAQKALDYLTKATSSATTTPTAEETSSPTPAPGITPAAESSQQTYGPVGDRPFVVFDDAKSNTPFERWIEVRAKEKMGEHGTKMGLFISTLFSNLPYMMLCCIPLFAFVLKILYVRRHIFYIDHLIYALHIHSFAYTGIMLIVLATIGLNRVVPGPIAGWTIALLWIAFVTQIFLSIRRVYRQGWLFSIFKFFFGGFVYLMVLLFALAITFFATLALP
jgi:ribosomal protein L32